MRRALLRSTVLLTLVASCAEEAPVRPPMLTGDAAFVFTDASVVGGDVGFVADRGGATDAGTAADADGATDAGTPADTSDAAEAGATGD